MKQYLEHSFPLEEIGRMMVMNGKSENYGRFKREVVFSVEGRYWRDPKQTITNPESLSMAIQRRIPEQIHFVSLKLWPYYTYGAESLEAKEVVFDIDLTDFPRYCACQGQKEKKVCTVCWQHIELCSFLLEYLLVQFYGIHQKHILWVLSGMKGIHCVINESRFLFLTLPQRVLLYQQLTLSTERDYIEFASHILLPHQEFVENFLELFERRSIRERNLMDSSTFLEDCLTLIKSEYFLLYDTLMLKWFNLGTKSSLEKWQALRSLEQGQFPPDQPLPSLVIALKFSFPRIDKKPLCEERHGFKLPFSVHQKTRRIALPVERSGLLKKGLPLNSITLIDVNAHYIQNASIHPDLLTSIRLFRQWLDCY